MRFEGPGGGGVADPDGDDGVHLLREDHVPRRHRQLPRTRHLLRARRCERQARGGGVRAGLAFAGGRGSRGAAGHVGVCGRGSKPWDSALEVLWLLRVPIRVCALRREGNLCEPKIGEHLVLDDVLLLYFAQVDEGGEGAVLELLL